MLKNVRMKLSFYVRQEYLELFQVVPFATPHIPTTTSIVINALLHPCSNMECRVADSPTPMCSTGEDRLRVLAASLMPKSSTFIASHCRCRSCSALSLQNCNSTNIPCSQLKKETSAEIPVSRICKCNNNHKENNMSDLARKTQQRHGGVYSLQLLRTS